MVLTTTSKNMEGDVEIPDNDDVDVPDDEDDVQHPGKKDSVYLRAHIDEERKLRHGALCI